MTSNVSFLTSCKENFKRRSWVTMLLGLYFFIIHIIAPITMVSQLERPIIDSELEYMQYAFNELLGFNYYTGLIMAAFAVLFALHGYSYLFNRRKMDLYLSVPTSTKKRFFVIQSTGVLTFISLYLISAGFALLIGLIGNFVTGTTITFFFFAFLLNTLLFITIYELTTIAVMMTGHIIVAVLAFIVFSVYELLLGLLHYGYLNTFMSHLILGDVMESSHSSPFYPYYILLAHLKQNDASTIVDSSLISKNILWLLALCTIFFFIAWFLYRKRPNEATDCAISFSKTKPVISIALQILAGLGGGLFFYSISYEKWPMALFGIFSGCLLIFCVLNIIFEFDIRAIFKNWKTLFISVLLVLIYFFIIVTDIFGIDSYIPKEETIVSCGIDSYEVSSIGYFNDETHSWNATQEHSPCTQMQLTNIEPFIALAEAGIDADYNYDGYYRSYTICYHLENGQSVYRSYSLSDEVALPILEKIYTSGEYTNSMIEKIDSNTIDADLDPYFDNGVYEVHISKDNMTELLNTYKKDLNYYTFEDNALGTPITQWKLYDGEDRYIELPIYENFSYTLALLERYNLADDIRISSDEIARIQLYISPENYDMSLISQNDVEDVYIDLSTEITITDPEEIDILMLNSIPSTFDSFYYYHTNFLELTGLEYNVDIYVYPKVGSIHEEDLRSSHFRYYGDIPGFIAENYYINY